MVWGVVTMCLGFVRNFAGFVTVRAILGVAEGGLLPGMVGMLFFPLGYSRLIRFRYCIYRSSTDERT